MPAPVLEPSTRTRPRRGTWVIGVGLFLAMWALFSAAQRGDDTHYDVYSANFESWHLAATGSPWLDSITIPNIDDSSIRDTWVEDPAPNGHKVVARSPGVVAAGLPGYWISRPAAMTVGPAALTAAILAAATILLMFLALRTRLTDRDAALTAALLGVATPIWAVSSQGLWPHTLTGLGIAGMAWAAATGRSWLVGIFGGITLWGRLHAAVVVAVVGLLLGRRERSLATVARVAVPSGLFLVAQGAWCHWLYGSWSPLAAYGGGNSVSLFSQTVLDPVNQLGMWVAPDRGLLVWTPVLLLLLPAVVREWRQLPAWSRDLAVAGLVYTVIQGSLITFTGGDFFYGYRLGLEFLVSATPALAFSVPRAGRLARPLLGPVLAVQVLAMATGAFGTRLWLPEDDVWRDNAFLHSLMGNPGAGTILVLAAALLGVAGQRLHSSTGSRARSDRSALVPVAVR